VSTLSMGIPSFFGIGEPMPGGDVPILWSEESGEWSDGGASRSFIF
jgi:hypothetical protein